jgi:hypothetical protein
MALAVLLAAATVVRAGESGGVELLYEFGADEGAAAAEVLTRRLELLGIEGGRAEALKDGRRVALRLEARDRLEEVRAMAARVGLLGLRRVVNPGTPGYEARRKELADALKRGIDPAAASAIPLESMTPKERERWPGGLRWYRNSRPSEALREEWVLCEADGRGITEKSFEEVRVAPSDSRPDDTGWTVHFRVKESFRGNMAALTRWTEGLRLAVILDGEVLVAPALRVELRDGGTITTPEEGDARAVAVAIGGGSLPGRPTLVEERAIER